MTSVPPTQPPAAPESDARLTEAEVEDLYRRWKQKAVFTHMLTGVERIVAERVRVVEGERDAAQLALGEQADIEREAFGRGVAWAMGDDEEAPAKLTARAESAEAAHKEAEQHIVQLTASRDRAEAAHERLVAAVEALADEYARRQARNAAHNGNVSCSVWGIAGAEVGRLAGGGAR